jgi:hypothetical protein
VTALRISQVNYNLYGDLDYSFVCQTPSFWLSLSCLHRLCLLSLSHMALSICQLSYLQGVTAAKNDGFSLTSGDFPTLGSEKDNSGKNESQGYI